MTEDWKRPLEIIQSDLPGRAGSPTASCTGWHVGRFEMTAKMKIPTPIWAAFSNGNPQQGLTQHCSRAACSCDVTPNPALLYLTAYCRFKSYTCKPVPWGQHPLRPTTAQCRHKGTAYAWHVAGTGVSSQILQVCWAETPSHNEAL